MHELASRFGLDSPSTLIIPADGAPRNWSSLPQLKSVSVLSEPVLVKSVESLFNVTSSEDGMKSVQNNDVYVPSVSVIISEVESALEARESVIKELVVCNEIQSRFAYVSEFVDDDDEMLKILKKKGKQIADLSSPSNDHCLMQVDEE